MKALQYAAGAVLLALLAVIAYDLHRVAETLAPAPIAVGRPETHAERDARLKREADLFAHDLAVKLGVGDLDKARKPSPSQSPSH